MQTIDNKKNIDFLGEDPMPKKIRRLALIGVGMIGGSFIWSMRNANGDAESDLGSGLIDHVIGVDLNTSELAHALNQGIIDSTCSLEELSDVDAIVIATPVGAMESIFAALKDKPFIKTAIITDVGSTKQSVIASAQAGLGYLPENFVPGHPIAGRENIGVQHAEKDMFRDHRAILTPHEQSSEATIATVGDWWRACGAIVDVMPAKDHDKILAATSHLPHVLSYSLMESLATTEYETPVFNYAAGGFKSFTRTASSNPVMWRDVCLNNKDEILYWLDHYQNTLSDLRDLIDQADGEAIVDIFQRSKSERDLHLVNKKDD